MPAPSDQSFTGISGFLGAGSVTFGGVTYFNTDPTAAISVTSEILSLGFSSFAQNTVGFKSAGGSEFTLQSLALFADAGSYGVVGYRDGVQVAATGTNLSGPANLSFGTFFGYIDEFRIVGPDND